MKFNESILRAMSSPAKIKMLKRVLAPAFSMTGREAARLAGISHTLAIKILKEFKELNLTASSPAGKSVVWMEKIS